MSAIHDVSVRDQSVTRTRRVRWPHISSSDRTRGYGRGRSYAPPAADRAAVASKARWRA